MINVAIIGFGYWSRNLAQPACTGPDYAAGKFPHSEKAAREALSLPIYAKPKADLPDQARSAPDQA